MSPTETKVLTSITNTKTKPLDMSQLKSVQWVANVGAVKQTYDYSADMYKSTTRRFPALAWIFASIEMVVISIYLFIHSLPWPDFILDIIYAIDRVIEHILENLGNKIEWWWDIFVIRLMWFRDSIEAMIDAFLSVTLFIVVKVIEFWTWAVTLGLKIFKLVFAPLIWILQTILPPQEKKSIPPSSLSEVKMPMPSPPTRDVNQTIKEHEPEEDSNRLSVTTSDCESDVSVVSETWSIGHTDKHGKSYNRVEMKATAEGRLRAAMYKRVKVQLTLMRKNSISFSRGMTSYAWQILEPKVKPAVASFRIWIRNLATKLGLVELFDRVSEWVENHYIASIILSSALYFAMVPYNLLNKILLRRKKKSRRTRSMRSESLRRRTGAAAVVVTPPGFAEAYGLNQSKEPVLVEEESEEFLLRKTSPYKSDDDAMRDSALASSIDDLCPMSDSNDGSNSLKDQVIHEEDKEDRHEEEEDYYYEMEERDHADTPKNLENGENGSAGIVEAENLKNTKTKLTPESKKKTYQNGVATQIETKLDKPTEKKTTPNAKAKQDKAKNNVATVNMGKDKRNGNEKVGPQSLDYRETSKMTKPEENGELKDQNEQGYNKSTTPKMPKRKISFSLTS